MSKPNMVVLGISHKTAPIEIRERLALDDSARLNAYRNLRGEESISELVLLSTCNRVEAYAVVDDDAGEAALREFLGSLAKGHAAKIKKALYEVRGESAVTHLLKVASSLDSMVVGESQILGQVKTAYQQAIEAGTVKKVFHGLFHRVFSAAKQVRTQTEIGRHAASVPSVAVNLAEHVFGDLSGCKVLLLGAGEMSELCAEYLKSAGVTSLTVANRTLSKAKDLAKKFSAQAAGLDDLDGLLSQADVVLASVGGKTPLLTKAKVSDARQGASRPLLIIDISVPRGVEDEVNDLEMTYAYNVDNLQQLAEKAQEKRLEASREAEHMLGRWKDDILNWLESGHVSSTITALNQKMEDLRNAELAKARKQLRHLEEEDMKKIDYLTKAIIKKVLHGPLRRLRSEQGENDHLARDLRALEDLFDLREEDS